MGLGIKIKELQLHHVPDSSLSCEICAGELVGITGPNGAGKTEMFRYLAGLNRTETMGEIVMDGLDPFHARDLEKLHRRIGMVCQNPEDTMVFSGLMQDAAFGPENQAVASETIQKRWEGLKGRLLSDVPEHMEFPFLSGGQQQRAALTSVLMLRSELLLLDEPFSMLGQAERRETLKLLLRLAKRNGQTVLLISHDPEVLRKMDRVLRLKNGQLKESKVKELFAEKEHAGEETGTPDGTGESDRTFHSAKTGKTGKSGKTGADGLDWIVHNEPEESEVLASLKDVSFRYGKNQVLAHFSAEIRRGGYYELCGNVGSGKSTLCKLINGILKTNSGQITVGGIELPRAGRRKENGFLRVKNFPSISKVRRFAGYVMQQPEDQLFASTVLQDVMYGSLQAGRAPETAEKDAEEALHILGVSKLLWNRRPDTLSGGEQRLVAIAGILTLRPEILILDEPFAGLDPESQERIRRMIQSYVNSDHAVLITSHPVVAEEKITEEKKEPETVGKAETPTAFKMEEPETEPVEKVKRKRPGRKKKAVGPQDEMTSKLRQGQYVAGTGILRRMDPRLKLYFLLIYSILLLLSPHPLMLGIATFVWIVLWGMSGCSLVGLLRSARGALFLLTVTTLFSMFWISIPAAMISFWRLTLMVLCSVLITKTTVPYDLLDGLREGFPISEGAAMSLAIAFDFLPEIGRETKRLEVASKSRGVIYEEGTILQRLKNRIPLMIPLFRGTLRHAGKLADAMDLRGYNAGVKRTRMFPLVLNKWDKGFAAGLMIYTFGMILLRIFL